MYSAQEVSEGDRFCETKIQLWCWMVVSSWCHVARSVSWRTLPYPSLYRGHHTKSVSGLFTLCSFNCTSLHAMSEKALLTWGIASYGWTQKFIFISQWPESWWNISGFLFNFSMQKLKRKYFAYCTITWRFLNSQIPESLLRWAQSPVLWKEGDALYGCKGKG